MIPAAEIAMALARYGYRLATSSEPGQFVAVAVDGDVYRVWAIRA